MKPVANPTKIYGFPWLFVRFCCACHDGLPCSFRGCSALHRPPFMDLFAVAANTLKSLFKELADVFQEMHFAFFL